MIQIDSSAHVSPLADIEDSIHETRIIIGRHVSIDSFVKIKPTGGLADLVIGEGSHINSGTVIYTGNGISIGKHVLIAANCTLAPVNHDFSLIGVTIRKQGFQPSRGGILIEDDVWVGANTVILDGAKVRSGAVIAAGSVVRGELSPNCVYGGNPLRLIRSRIK